MWTTQTILCLLRWILAPQEASSTTCGLIPAEAPGTSSHSECRAQPFTMCVGRFLAYILPTFLFALVPATGAGPPGAPGIGAARAHAMSAAGVALEVNPVSKIYLSSVLDQSFDGEIEPLSAAEIRDKRQRYVVACSADPLEKQKISDAQLVLRLRSMGAGSRIERWMFLQANLLAVDRSLARSKTNLS
jgi:hypothetical protein